jgi:putative FmdB family regulatory protein
MPILEYLCKDCAHQFETIIQGAQVPTCPVCNSQRLERQLSVFAVGGKSTGLAAREPVSPCSTCGDPRGPGCPMLQ